MGTLEQGLFGGFSGKVGNVVGVCRQGVYYVRSLPAKVNDPKTEKQVKQRGKFAVVMDFLKAITPFVRVGFQFQAEGAKSAFNAAMSYNIRHGVKSGKEGVELDWPNVLISRGSLGGAREVHVEIAQGELRVGWDSRSKGNARGDDVAMILAYNSVKQQPVYDLNASKRATGIAAVRLPRGWEGDTIETFLAFKTADGIEVSDSIYLGRYVVSPGSFI